MGTLFNYILTELPGFKQINGYKTQIGALLVFLSYVAGGLVQVATAFPQTAALAQASTGLGDFITHAVSITNSIGWGGIAIGLYHKEIK